MSEPRISDTWSLFNIEPDSVLELRAIHYKQKHTKSYIFRVEDFGSIGAAKEAFLHKADELNKKGWNIYTTLNPINKEFQGRTAKDQNISHRTLLLIDIDRAGDTKCPASEEEIQRAEALVSEILKYLHSQGWPRPGVVMSGNGYHIYFRLADLPNDDRSKHLVSDVLKALAKTFNNEHVSIDTTVSNASRITKVPGTIARKGEETKGRPYRKATLIAAPSDQRHVTGTMLEEILQSLNKVHIDKTPQIHQLAISSYPENPENVAKLKEALSYISSDVSRGRGAIDITNPQGDNWLGCIWAIAGLGWSFGKDIAREWSIKSDKYVESEFNKDWSEYDHSHPKPIRIWSLLRLAEKSGYSEFGPLVFADQESITPKKVISEQLEFKFYTAQELQKLPPLSWRAKGLLPETGLASVYGPSGSGKSFFIIDLIAKIALGEDFYGKKVKACPVIYVPLEGTGGVPNRIKAYEKHFNTQLPSTFRIVTERISLLTTDAVRFAEAINHKGFQNGVIVIDTLNQSAPEADENTSSDMGTIIKNAQILQKITNSLVILVHHTGKDASRGARGHSSFFAALDAGIELKKTPSGREWMVSKSKDGEDGISHPFKLEQVLLGKDEDGENITSCVISPDIFRAELPKSPQGKNQKAVLAHLIKVMGSTQKTKEEIESMAKDALSGSNQMTRAKEAVDKLIELGHLVEIEAGDKYYLYDSLGKNVARFRSPYRGTEKTEKVPELEFSENETKRENERLPIMRSCVELEAGILLGP